MMSFQYKSVALATVPALATIAGSASAALAQTTSKTSDEAATNQKSASALQTTDISNAKLDSFAKAYLGVSKIKQEYTPKLKQAKDDETRQKVKLEASRKMVETVNGVDGMNVKEYSAILASAQSNPKLARKLTEAINHSSDKNGEAGK
ncbi:DUF4168 domain-containing protein [Pararhizobium mangrovi]|uniref:DUF4168 domain-containing protein n=1 Tax=Pararhizobium mangrovi TaxID=2590452 RepID=A0A506UCJ1_9HYPH|nr:DUF4168 domain-containing protein [Pararhizobium mangrovi]TPW31318.1 DUF4168 domain-containing protein [Pararhizobium mangrovi]